MTTWLATVVGYLVTVLLLAYLFGGAAKLGGPEDPRRD